MVVSIYYDSWSGIQGFVQCIVTVVSSLHYNKLDKIIFISIYQFFYLN